MNYTKKVVIRMDKISSTTNEAPVCLRITVNRQTTYKTLFRVKPEFWDDNKKQIKKKHPKAAQMNADLSQLIANIEAEMMKLDAAKQIQNISELRNKLRDKKYLDLLEYADTFNQQLYEKGDFSTYKTYKSVITKLRNYSKAKELPINTIDLNFIKKYELYLSETLKNKPSTIAKNMKAIAKYINDIYEQNGLEHFNNPFNKYKIKRIQAERCFLSEEEVKRIESLKIKLQSPLFDARETYLFQCFTGLRISDVLCLKWKNVEEGQLKGKMKKTKREYNIPLISKAKQLIECRMKIASLNGKQIMPEQYVFNILTVDYVTATPHELGNNISSKTAIINKHLKKIAQLAQIDKNISTHIGRHTLATLLITKGADIYQVKEILGHTDVRTTQQYAKMTDERKREAMDLLNNL